MKKNELVRQMRAYRGDDESYESKGKMRKPTIGGAKSVYRGRKTRREQMEGIILGIEMKFLQEDEDKMAGLEYYPRMKKHGKMSDAQKKAVTSVYDKKPIDKKMANDPQVKKAQRYMKVEQVMNDFMESSSWLQQTSDTREYHDNEMSSSGVRKACREASWKGFVTLIFCVIGCLIFGGFLLRA